MATGFIPEEIIEQIQNRSDIVEIISGYIPLKRAGNSFKALCPFHNEKTPSFMVNPPKQIWHCFGCGLGGNVFNFVMKYEKLEFPDAVRLLARKTGVEIPQYSRESAEGQSRNKRLYRINELATSYFHNNLLDERKGKLARQYLTRRKINLEIIKKFRLGFAINQWEGFLEFAKKKGEKEEFLKLAGLIIPRKDHGYYDRFRNRLIFPIFDLQGRVLAFGGRVLDESLPKYINSPETPLFNKGRCLYGLNLAKEFLGGDNNIIIVEGYMDLLSLYRMGIGNVVATLGTALTTQHARLLKRYVSTVVMVYDADQAGEAASVRGLEILLEEELRIKVVKLPKGFDPDSFIIAKGKENFQRAVISADDLFDYKLGLLTDKYDLEKLEEKAKVAAEMLLTISRINNAVLKSGYIRKLSKRLSIDENSLLLELKKVKQKGFSYYQSQKDSALNYKLPVNIRERTLVGLMLEDFKIATEVKNSLTLEDFQDLRLRRIAATVFKLISEKKKFTPSQIINYLRDEQSSQLISELSTGSQMTSYTGKGQVGGLDKEKIAGDCIGKMKLESLKRARINLQKRIKLAEELKDDKERMKLLTEFKNLLELKV